MDDADRADQEIESGIQDGLWKARQLLYIQQQLPRSEWCFCQEVKGVPFCGDACIEEYRFDKARGRIR